MKALPNISGPYHLAEMSPSTLTTIFLTLIAATVTVRAQVLNGYSLGRATYALSQGGSQAGVFRAVTDLAWEWAPNGQTPSSFTIVGRDQWSVYLCGGSPKRAVQIDYFQKVITVNDGSTVKTFYILSASLDTIRGRNVGSAELTTGVFTEVQNEFKKWIWINFASGSTRKYSEVGRDEWSVYLKDASDSVQIDIFLQRVFFTGPSPPTSGPPGIVKTSFSTKAYRTACL